MATFNHFSDQHRVRVWLQDLPHCRDPSLETRAPKRKLPLAEMDANIQAPAKVARVDLETECTEIRVGEDARTARREEDHATAEDTPRPRGRVSEAVPLVAVHIPSFAPPAPRDDDIGSSATTSATSDASTNKKRKRSSPVRKMASLRNAEYGVDQRFIRGIMDLPESLRPLVKSMKEVELGRGIIPIYQSETLKPYLIDGFDDDHLTSPDRHLMGECPDITFVRNILEHVEHNTTFSASEAAWNCNVHSPLLDHAWRSSPYRERVRWHNITTAAIEPHTLLPGLTSSERFQSKKADFCIALVQNADVERRLTRAGLDSLNQTYYSPLQYSPSAISIETKTPGESWDEANLQLCTWALGQVAKLRQLLQKAGNAHTSIPALPLIVVQGETWTFLYFEAGPTKASVWRRVTIGHTTSARGVYQIVVALQRLIWWAETVYRSWFEASILDPLLATMY